MSIEQLPDRARVDAFDKVRGTTKYAADFQRPGMLHAVLVPSLIAKGKVVRVDTAAALAVPGVLRVLTPEDFPEPNPDFEAPTAEDEEEEGGEGYAVPSTVVNMIAYRGQPIAVVIAETPDAAVEGAEKVTGEYEEEPFSVVMESPGAQREPIDEAVVAGNAEEAFGRASVIVEETYVSPTQHHNPLELLGAMAVFEDGRLTIYDTTQHTMGVKNAVAASLWIDPARIDVKSTSVGGGFGQKAHAYGYSVIAAHAALLTGRPVRIVIPRGHIFHIASYRPRSMHHIRLGADSNGQMIAAKYVAEHENSREGGLSPAEYHEGTPRLYDIANYHGGGIQVRLDRQDAGYMRCPFPHQACFAFESAVDELAYKLGMDPVALRLKNDGQTDPLSGKPYSSRFVTECITEGARRFGWSRRSHAPGSMTAPNGAQVGWGMALGNYPSPMSPAIATLRIGANGRTRITVSGHEMGQGIKTTIANTLLQGLDVDPNGLEIVIGDTSAAPQHQTGASCGTAGCVPATLKAVRRMQAALQELMGGRSVPGNIHRQLAMIRRPCLQIEVSEVAPGQGAEAIEYLRVSGDGAAGPEYPEFTSMSWIAHFVEVRVEPTTRRIRMPRCVSVVDCGRVISPRTARSQVHGGVVWAFSAALREATEIDPRYGGYLNCDLAEYLIAVNADIGEIEVGFVDKPDPMANSAGLKSLGEVVMAGASAAIANAIFHATGKRLRSMPFRIEDLL
ncbi:xanthine dehydrogenase family protein molybdopterin-binding subunit [Oceanibaculum indicum]|uniref:Molybdopterin binding aldehyde oxidase and xanthine dehydrogenase n=1 Tax=Oceanibaculum indicum P24 TaxID=1207063 RepID=K2JNQ7_9PROT|nr:xanthine dehydrogenase family protein molybdopterin-binding subunit [Oceanibaculum indicum]EKE72099.1 molybdopterin binding aldehyde oxidase and xanthine dehydrogenase [Oceanibaculum indicum P24]